VSGNFATEFQNTRARSTPTLNSASEVDSDQGYPFRGLLFEDDAKGWRTSGNVSSSGACESKLG
jgi:hypothetical protein